jgi:hypothetical protein
MGPVKKVGILKIAQPNVKPSPQGTSKIELALVKPLAVSNKFRLLDVVASSQGPHTVGTTMIHATRVLTSDNLGDDSSLDVRKTPSPERMVERRVPPPTMVSGEFLYFRFALLLWA